MMAFFQFDDSFPGKTGSCRTGMVYLSFNVEYPGFGILGTVKHELPVFSETGSC